MIKQLLAVALVAASFGALADDLSIDRDFSTYEIPNSQVWEVQQMNDWSTWDHEEWSNWRATAQNQIDIRDSKSSRAEVEALGVDLFGAYEHYAVSPEEQDFVRSAAFLTNAKFYGLAKKSHNESRAEKAIDNSGDALQEYANHRSVWNVITGYEGGFYGETTRNARVKQGWAAQVWIPNYGY